MKTKIIGAILIICACGGFGFYLSHMQKKEEKSLRELLRIINYMSTELLCRLTPLPELCYQISNEFGGSLGKIFSMLAKELDKQLAPDANMCMLTTLNYYADIPEVTGKLLQRLGQTLGRYDISGQSTQIQLVREECERNLRALCDNKELRFRTYHTLGLCAGAALAILFI